jgi:hypothetical protein
VTKLAPKNAKVISFLRLTSKAKFAPNAVAASIIPAANMQIKKNAKVIINAKAFAKIAAVALMMNV